MSNPLDERIRKDLVEFYGPREDENPNYQPSILRETVNVGASRACKRCGALVQVADFKFHDGFHNQIDGMLSNLMLAHELIDMVDDRVRRRYNQRNNMNAVSGALLPRGSDLFPNARVYREKDERD